MYYQGLRACSWPLLGRRILSIGHMSLLSLDEVPGSSSEMIPVTVTEQPPTKLTRYTLPEAGLIGSIDVEFAYDGEHLHPHTS